MSQENKAAGREHIPDFPSPPPAGVNWLLVIAIDEYDPVIGRLNNCVKDVRAFIDVVTQRYHFDSNKIIPLFNADATGEAIEAAFRKLLKEVKTEDNLVIYYSGHGDYDDDIDLGYWIPADAKNRRQGLHNDLITRFLNRIPSRHTLLLCDSCFSGSLLLEEPTKNIGQRYYSQPSRWAITSGARELVSDGKEHSPFAKALLRVLQHTNGDVDILTLGGAIMEEVAANERQKPLFAPLRVSGHQGGMFVFFQKQNEAQEWTTTEAADTAAAYYAFWQKYPDHPNAEEALWRYACINNELADFQLYRKTYPQGKYRFDVLDKMDDVTFANATTIPQLRSYLNIFGDSANHAAEAHERIDALLGGIVLKTPAPKFIYPDSPEEIKFYLNNISFKPEMMPVRGGILKMGREDGEKWARPVHEVSIQNFYIGKYPVTFAEYDAFCEATKRKKPNDRSWGRERRPVINVSWHDAKAYCQWLSEQTGKNYRLPSEAEWEFAASGGMNAHIRVQGWSGKGFKYAGSDNLDEVGWYKDNAEGKTHPVGEKKPNELGIYDLSGNVWEWCEDVWHENYEGAPTDGSAWMSGGNQDRRVLRGGSWGSLDISCRVANRDGDSPNDRGIDLGFRLAQD